jgi:hypothetical protein
LIGKCPGDFFLQKRVFQVLKVKWGAAVCFACSDEHNSLIISPTASSNVNLSMDEVILIVLTPRSQKLLSKQADNL